MDYTRTLNISIRTFLKRKLFSYLPRYVLFYIQIISNRKAKICSLLCFNQSMKICRKKCTTDYGVGMKKEKDFSYISRVYIFQRSSFAFHNACTFYFYFRGSLRDLSSVILTFTKINFYSVFCNCNCTKIS